MRYELQLLDRHGEALAKDRAECVFRFDSPPLVPLAGEKVRVKGRPISVVKVEHEYQPVPGGVLCTAYVYLDG